MAKFLKKASGDDEENKESPLNLLRLTYPPHDLNLEHLGFAQSELHEYANCVAEYSQDIATLKKFLARCDTLYRMFKPITGRFRKTKIELQIKRCKIFIHKKEYNKAIPMNVHDELMALYDLIIELINSKNAQFNLTTQSNYGTKRAEQKIIN